MIKVEEKQRFIGWYLHNKKLSIGTEIFLRCLLTSGRLGRLAFVENLNSSANNAIVIRDHGSPEMLMRRGSKANTDPEEITSYFLNTDEHFFICFLFKDMLCNDLYLNTLEVKQSVAYQTHYEAQAVSALADAEIERAKHLFMSTQLMNEVDQALIDGDEERFKNAAERYTQYQNNIQTGDNEWEDTSANMNVKLSL